MGIGFWLTVFSLNSWSKDFPKGKNYTDESIDMLVLASKNIFRKMRTGTKRKPGIIKTIITLFAFYLGIILMSELANTIF
jgi:hypothetical protein